MSDDVSLSAFLDPLVRAVREVATSTWVVAEISEYPKSQHAYERHFTDSEHLGDDTMNWGDGQIWRTSPERSPHLLQVGDYPAWRGLAKAARRLR